MFLVFSISMLQVKLYILRLDTLNEIQSPSILASANRWNFLRLLKSSLVSHCFVASLLREPLIGISFSVLYSAFNTTSLCISLSLDVDS